MKCRYCDRSAKSLNSNVQHEIRCRSNPNHIVGNYIANLRQGSMTINPTPCPFCSMEFTNKIGLGNHKIRCPKNPNRQIQTMSEEGKHRARVANQEKNQRLWSDPVFRQRHRESMRRAVERNPESYTSANRGRTKQIEHDGLKFQGRWELDFYLWAKKEGLYPQRNTKGFSYNWNGERTYFPDFYIACLDAYIEIKGYETDRDRAKWDQFPKKLLVIKEQQIRAIKNGNFAGLT